MAVLFGAYFLFYLYAFLGTTVAELDGAERRNALFWRTMEPRHVLAISIGLVIIGCGIWTVIAATRGTQHVAEEKDGTEKS